MGRSNDELDDLLEGLDQDDNLVRQLRALVKDRDKRLRDLEDENGKLSKAVRTRTVSEVLKSKGVNEKVANFIPTDVDPTPEAVEAWLTENADVFGIKLNADADAGAGNEGNGGSAVSQEGIEALQSIDSTVSTAVTPGKEADLIARMNAATTFEEFQQIVQQAGGPTA